MKIFETDRKDNFDVPCVKENLFDALHCAISEDNSEFSYGQVTVTLYLARSFLF